MADLRNRIEREFERAATVLCRRRWWALAAILIVFAGLAAGIPRLKIDTSSEAFLHADDPILSQYYDFKDLFGREDLILVAIEPDQLFTLDTFARIKALHDDLVAKVPHMDDIVSLVNARNTQGEADRLVVDDLLAVWPETAADLAGIESRVRTHPLYQNQLISADGTVTTLVIKIDTFSNAGADSDALSGFDDAPAAPTVFLSDAESRATVEAVQAVVKAHDSDDFRLSLAGTPSVTEALKRAIQADMKLFMALALLGIGLCLLAMFQRIVGVALPLLVVILSLISTMGIMGYSGVSIKVPTVILPSFLLAVCVGAAVHVLAIFFQRLEHRDKREAAIVFALGHSGLPIVMTSLTTAVGLGSFATAEVSPIADLGIFASLGTMLSLFYTITLLPVLLALIPVKPHHETGAGHTAVFDRLLRTIADFSTGHARAIVITGLLALAVFLASASQLRFTHDVLAWLPEDWPVSQATRMIDDKMRGSVVVEILVDTGRDNGLYDPAVLTTLDDLARQLETYSAGDLFVGKILSVADILKEIHQALNENRPEFYAIPDNPKLIPQEFLLFENVGSDDLEDVIDSTFRIARFTIRVPWRDTLVYVPFLAEVNARFDAAFGPDTTITTTGIMSLLSRTLDAAIRSAAKSYVIAFAMITLMMVALIGSLKLGLVSMLPNLTPIVVTMGGMLWVDIPLNLFTMLVGSIAIGLAVDDTVHFMHNFRRYHGQSGDVRAAVRQTLHTTGRAMLVTSIVLAVGFYIFAFAALNNVIQFGLLTGTAILLALVANFLMTPALMVLLIPDNKEDKS